MNKSYLITILIVIVIGLAGATYKNYSDNGRFTWFDSEDKTELAKALFERGESFAEQEKYDAAILLFEEVVEDYPETIYAEMSITSIEVYSTLRDVKETRSQIMERLNQN